MKTVYLNRAYGVNNAGERCGLPDDVADALVASGGARFPEPKKAPVTRESIAANPTPAATGGLSRAYGQAKQSASQPRGRRSKKTSWSPSEDDAD